MCLLAYPCQVCCHRLLTLCISSLFLLTRPINRENLRSAGISRFVARPLQYSGSHHSRRGHPLALCLDWAWYSGTSIAVDSPRAPCSSLAWLLACRCMARCCLGPRGGRVPSSLMDIPLLPAPNLKGSAYPEMRVSRGYVSDSGLHPSPRRTRYFSFLSLRIQSFHYRAVD